MLLVATIVAATYGIMNRPPAESLSANERVLQILESGGCASCHSATPDLPFYANFPIADKMIAKDVGEGFRAFDIDPLMAALRSSKQPNVVDVAKVEKVMLDQRMPPAKYYLVHWGSTTTRAKRDIILNWALNFRQAYYNDALPSDRAGEPIRPIPTRIAVDGRKVELGRQLYHDVRLSADNTVSCASCHGLNTAGVDNKQYSEGVQGQKGGVNAPTVYNAAFNFVQFWDGRATTLAEQAAGPPLNPVEMASPSFDDIIAKLDADKAFKRAFEDVYPDGFSEANITNAIEEFERTLITPNSAFDKYLRGDDNAITANQKLGYELFKRYDCATCHVGVNLGGESYELMGLRDHYFNHRGVDLTEEDYGRYKVTKQERDRHRFKVPGLRNVELTWPYYHDGTRATLEEAVRDMGKYQSGVELSAEEVNAITDFLSTLTGEFEGKPLTNDNKQ